jgi:hypothetical protein
MPFKSGSMKVLDYSFNEAKLMCIEPRGVRYPDFRDWYCINAELAEKDTPLIDNLIITPMLNTRIVPQFYNG